MTIEEYLQQTHRPGEHSLVGVSPRELQKLLNEREDLLAAVQEILNICDGSPMTQNGRLKLIRNIARFHAREVGEEHSQNDQEEQSLPGTRSATQGDSE